MTEPTTEELDAAVAGLVGPNWYQLTSYQEGENVAGKIHLDWSVLMAAVAKLENETGWAFERDKEGFWRAIRNDGTGEIYTSMFWFIDDSFEAHALARCIYAVVNQ